MEFFFNINTIYEPKIIEKTFLLSLDKKLLKSLFYDLHS